MGGEINCRLKNSYEVKVVKITALVVEVLLKVLLLSFFCFSKMILVGQSDGQRRYINVVKGIEFQCIHLSSIMVLSRTHKTTSMSKSTQQGSLQFFLSTTPPPGHSLLMCCA